MLFGFQNQGSARYEEAAGHGDISRRYEELQEQMMMSYSPRSIGPSQSSSSFWIWRSPQEQRRREFMTRHQQQSSLTPEASSLRLRRLLLRPLAILIFGSCISIAWQNFSGVTGNREDHLWGLEWSWGDPGLSLNRKALIHPRKIVYPSISLGQTGRAVEGVKAGSAQIASVDLEPPQQEEQDQTQDPSYGWEPTMYPDPIEDPIRCGIYNLINGSTEDNFEFLPSGNGTMQQKPMMINTKLCDPDLVLGGTYLEEIAAALAQFGERFGHPETSFGKDAETQPVSGLWQGRRILYNREEESASTIRHTRALISGNNTTRLQGSKNFITETEKPASSVGRAANQSAKSKSQEEKSGKVDRGESSPHHIGLVVEAPSSDADNKMEKGKKKSKEKTKGVVRPPIELAVATVRKVCWILKLMISFSPF